MLFTENHNIPHHPTVLQVMGQITLQQLQTPNIHHHHSHQQHHHQPYQHTHQHPHMRSHHPELLTFRRSKDQPHHRDVGRKYGSRSGSRENHWKRESVDSRRAEHEKHRGNVQRRVDFSSREKHRQNDQSQCLHYPKDEILDLKQRVEKLESMLQRNIERVNDQTVNTMRQMDHQLNQRISSQDQTLNRRMDRLAKFNQQWRKDNLEEMKNHQKELEKELQQLKEEIQLERLSLKQEVQELKRLERQLKEKRQNPEQIQQIIMQIIEEEKKQLQSIRSRDIYLQESLKNKIKQEIRKIQTQQKRQNQSLQNRLHFRIKQQIQEIEAVKKQIEVLKRKTGCGLDRNSRIIQAKQLVKKEQKSEKTEQEQQSMIKILQKTKTTKSSVQYLFDSTTPYAKNFKAEGNRITLIKEEWKDGQKIYNQQVLLNVLVRKIFSFSSQIIRTKKQSVMIGIVDKKTQKDQMNSFASGNAICYSGYKGRINYGAEGEWVYKDVGDSICEGMKVIVEVNLCRVTFTLTHPDKPTKTHSITSTILCEPNRHFVPFFQMTFAGDSIQWCLQ